MEPRIQYAKTSDGVSIAFWTLGKGEPPLVLLPLQFSHTQLEWQLDECRGWYEGLAQKRRVIRYDPRGTGMSDRDARVRMDSTPYDLEAVVDKLGLGRFALFGGLYYGPAAIACAARYPHRVSNLILWCATAAMADWLRSPQMQALVSLRDKDWEFYSEAAARGVLGWSAGEPARRVAALMRESATRETLVSSLARIFQVDVTRLLAEVKSPTLVLHRRQYAALSVDAAKGLAARIPNARLALLEGESGAPYLGDMDGVLAAIDEFLGESAESAHPGPGLLSGTAVILFADIVDSTALTERLGDAAFRAKARELGPTLRALIRECTGTPVEGPTLGDGVLAVFTSAREAIEAARRCAKAGDDAGLPLHLGLHAGDVTREKDPDGRDNVYGGAVNIASRISSLSAPGEVLVSETVRSLARTSAGVTFDDRGEHALKGVGEPVRVWAVKTSEGGLQ